MKIKIPLILAVIIILGLGIYALKKHETGLALTPPVYIYTQAAGVATTSTAGILSTPVASSAWTVFEAYTKAAKNHDLSTLMKLVYKVSDACRDPKQSAECNKRMDKAYSITSSFKEADFKNVAYDDRQIILSTDWHVAETDAAIGEARSVIYFVRDVTGAPKVLFFTQPEEIVYSFLDPKQTKDALIKRLTDRIKDSDGDTLTDEVETCTYESADPKTCVKTDPNNKDTNGNGWWDSVEQYIK